MEPISESDPPEVVIARVLGRVDAWHTARAWRASVRARAARLEAAEQRALELAQRRARQRAAIRAYYKVAGPIDY